MWNRDRKPPKGSVTSLLRATSLFVMAMCGVIFAVDAQEAKFKHFGMASEFLPRQKPKWRIALQDILFQDVDIVEHG